MVPSTQNITQNEWTIYLVSFLVLAALFFIQKYAYLIDRKLSKAQKIEPAWEGKPWALLAAILLGIFTLLYNVFSPDKMQQNPMNWHWAVWVIIFCFLLILVLLAAESISHFGTRLGLVRFGVLGALCVGFYFAGLLAGLLIVSILALLILIYFLNFWRKKMAIK